LLGSKYATFDVRPKQTPKTPATAGQAAKDPARKATNPRIAADADRPAQYLKHPTGRRFRAHLSQSKVGPAPKKSCFYRYGKYTVQKQPNNDRDGKLMSSSAINLIELSNDNIDEWFRAGKNNPQLCYGYFLGSKCEYGKDCHLRHIKLTPREAMDISW